MEAALRALLPKIVDTLAFDIRTYSGKQDLLKKLPNRLRGYARTLSATARILVIVDRDNEDCAVLKGRLERLAVDANLVTRTQARGKPYHVVNRIVVEELEAWYFGDWEAVRASFPKVPPGIPLQKKYRDPDAITGGTWEAFERELQREGYFPGGLTKIGAASRIAANMDPERNTSKSFQCLRATLLEMVR